VQAIIRSPKDGIDSMIEQGKAIDSMLALKPGAAAQEAREHMHDADVALSRARAASARIHQPRSVVT
jgi:CHAD domain-containing protein